MTRQVAADTNFASEYRPRADASRARPVKNVGDVVFERRLRHSQQRTLSIKWTTAPMNHCSERNAL